MRNFKDVFYDKNDILVALLIILVAGLIIYSRINVIMDYPQVAAEAVASQSQGQESPQASQGNDGAVTSSSDATTSSSGKNDIVIDITEGDNATTVAKKLEDAGCIASAADFEALLKEYNVDKTLTKGTVNIPYGSDYRKIIELITAGEAIR